MGKSEDSRLRRKNKLIRKKQNESSQVSTRVASIIAAKNRRKTGKRSMCQGMCYSLPTPEDPFNDRALNVDFTKKESKKVKPSKTPKRTSTNRNGAAEKKGTKDISQVKPSKAKLQQIGKRGAALSKDGNSFVFEDCPSKFLIVCLNSIQSALRLNGTISNDEEKPLYADAWGLEFWTCYSMGKDMLETSLACSTMEQIAWIAATATDTIARKENKGLSFNNPFLLFLVPSQEKASMVRSVCKPLKPIGIHTVSLHPGASMEHQIEGLRSCEPEFLVSTPDRLLELLSLKAIDLSGVSLVVVDGLETLTKSGQSDIIKSIRQHISGNPLTVVFNDCSSYTSVPAVRNLLPRSVSRLSLNDSIASQSACIIQSVHVCDFEEEKLAKGFQVLDHISGNELGSGPIKVLFIVRESSDSQEVVSAIKSKGYPISTIGDGAESESSEKALMVFLMDMEHIETADLSEFDVALISNFVPSIDTYVQILTGMARFTVNGTLHSFLTKKDALLAPPLIEILENCGQEVPEALRHLHESSTFSGSEH